MTRSVTIVNTSNWEHEDVGMTAIDQDGRVETAMLKPGDSVTVGPYGERQHWSIALWSRLPAEPKPFKDADGNQDWPKVTVHKPAPSEPEAV